MSVSGQTKRFCLSLKPTDWHRDLCFLDQFVCAEKLGIPVGGSRSVAGHLVRGALVVGSLFLAACGGSDASTSDTSVDSDATVDSTIAVDNTAGIAEFCESSNSNDSDLPQIEATDDAAAITEKITVLAKSLSDTAAKAPDAVKAESQTLADAATAMAEALTSDPTLESFDAVVEKFATPEIDAATVAIEKFVNEKCGAAQ